MIYANTSNAKMQEHGNIARIVTKKNPYWLVYDLIKLEERDGQVNLHHNAGILRGPSSSRATVAEATVDVNQDKG